MWRVAHYYGNSTVASTKQTLTITDTDMLTYRAADSLSKVLLECVWAMHGGYLLYQSIIWQHGCLSGDFVHIWGGLVILELIYIIMCLVSDEQNALSDTMRSYTNMNSAVTQLISRNGQQTIVLLSEKSIKWNFNDRKGKSSERKSQCYGSAHVIIRDCSELRQNHLEWSDNGNQ